MFETVGLGRPRGVKGKASESRLESGGGRSCSEEVRALVEKRRVLLPLLLWLSFFMASFMTCGRLSWAALSPLSTLKNRYGQSRRVRIQRASSLKTLTSPTGVPLSRSTPPSPVTLLIAAASSLTCGSCSVFGPLPSKLACASDDACPVFFSLNSSADGGCPVGAPAEEGSVRGWTLGLGCRDVFGSSFERGAVVV